MRRSTSDNQAASNINPDCPWPVTALAMQQWWERLTFIHWSYDPDIVQRLLPPSLRVEWPEQVSAT